MMSAIQNAELPQRMRVLIADDEFINRMLLRKMLERRGHQVSEAGNGEQAWSLARVEPFDLILLDINMPVLDGYGCAERIRRQPGPNRQTTIVAITGNGLDEDRKRSEQAGMNAHLIKPIRLDALDQMVRQYEKPPT